MKMAAFTMLTADEESCTEVSVKPWFGFPPPQRATSMISPPCNLCQLPVEDWKEGLAWEYPTKTSYVSGHLELKELTADATALMPECTELL